jgi:hypothetical protein
MGQKTKRVRKIRSRTRRSKRQAIKSQEEQDQNQEHHYYSKMFFDGNTMFTESQKDNEPVKRRKYTLKQLEREIPIGAELIKEHLDHKVPPAINYPLPKEIEFKSVLPNPIDLGLMPPQISSNHTRKRRKHHDHDHHTGDGENLRLMIEDHDRKKRPRSVFELP